MAIKNLTLKLKRFKHIFFFIVLYFVFLFFFSCAYKQETPPPADLIEESKMAQVITDITISEAILTNEPLASLNDSIKKINILKEHGVSSQQFLSSMKYYSENPSKLQDIYLEVSDLIGSKQGVVDTTKK